jgi:hypothetical protein
MGLNWQGHPEISPEKVHPMTVSLRPTPRRLSLSSKRERVREATAIAFAAVAIAVTMFGVVVLSSHGGREWLVNLFQ